MIMKVLLFFVFLLAGEVYAHELRTFKHSSGVFEMMVPSGWKKNHPLGDNNITTFTSENGLADLTISITLNLKLPDELPEFVMAGMFPEETPIGNQIRRRGRGWDSLRQDWLGIKNGVKTVWLSEFFGYKTSVVAVTLSDVEELAPKHKDLFDKIIESIKFI